MIGLTLRETVTFLHCSMNSSLTPIESGILRQVHGAITFYHYFRGAASVKHTVSLCLAGARQSGGGDPLAVHALPRPARTPPNSRDPAPA